MLEHSSDTEMRVDNLDSEKHINSQDSGSSSDEGEPMVEFDQSNLPPSAMHIYKPDWVCHLDEKGKRAPIYSLHVHPDGTRLATGAQDGKVKIWNMETLANPNIDITTEPSKHLCTMSVHNGAVLCVKWSSEDGKYLATGSDDMIVMIWQLDRSSESWGGATFGSNDGPNVETWRGYKRLSGHESDVTDVSWSPDNKYLASAGLDSKIIIWDGKSFDRIITLDKHSGFVKGLTWDPVGKYMASQSDDKTVRIWRISDWQVEVLIEKPYQDSTGTTFFRRLSWSPEGGHIVTANAFSNDKPVAAVISRDNWNADISLVGHDAPVEVVSFNPLLYRYIDSKGNSGLTSIVAVGSQDRGLTVWKTSDPRPFVGIKELFEHSFLDMCWTPDGKTLLACSYDGSVIVLIFPTGALGEAVPVEERHRMLAKYGYERQGAVMAETALQLQMEEKLKDSTAQSRMDALMQPDVSMEGVTSTFDKPSDPSVFTEPVSSQPLALSSTSTAAPAPPSSPSSTAQPRPPQVNLVASQQQVTITSDGKKRIKPLFLGNGMGMGMGMAPSSPMARLQIQSPGGYGSVVSATDRVERGEPSTSIPEGGFPTVVVGTKRKDAPASGNVSSGAPAKRGPDNGVKGKTVVQKEEEAPPRNAVSSPLLAVSRVRLGVPRVRANITRNRAGLECHNSITGAKPNKVIYSQKGSPVWVDYLPSPVLLMTGNSQFSAVTCEDGGLYIYSPSGRRLMPCIQLEAAATLLECDSEYLLCLTSCGLVSTWNVIQQVAILSSVSISPLLQPTVHEVDAASSSVSITSATVRQNGLPLLTTSAGHGYTYHEGMKVWVKVVDPWFAKSSFFSEPPRDAPGDFGSFVPQRKGVLAQLQSAAMAGRLEKDVSFAQGLLTVDDTVQSAVTLTYLENQIASAQVLGSPVEFKRWLRCYAQQLAHESSVARVEELCKYLLGPVYQGGERSGWQVTILGHQKRELLRELLPVLSSNRSLQRIVKEYQSGLDMVTKPALDSPKAT
ncbi:HIR complex subunit [Linnemannia exigua]|uniref:Protein HIR n=1 Tax=Linnemannia exigua TaxID=604196 RepID=A0AAD4H587_9FUNG|nr:HIR complex subunit [Linnemannia exigua]